MVVKTNGWSPQIENPEARWAKAQLDQPSERPSPRASKTKGRLEMMEFRKWEEAQRAGLRTRTQWGNLGRNLLAGIKAEALFVGAYGDYSLYPESATIPKKIVPKIPAKEIDLLAALFTVTRAAKRFRNAAAASYAAGAHGFAGSNRRKKEKLYGLKDLGLALAFADGRLTPTAASGNLTLYRGEGFCFHSLLRPFGWTPSQNNSGEPLTVEAKPKSAKEPRLKDAIFTLEKLPDLTSGLERIPFPSRLRPEKTEDYMGDYEDEENLDYEI